MQRYLIVLWLALLPGLAFAGKIVTETLTIAVAGAAGTNTTSISGYLDTIYFDVTGTVTGDVDITYSHPESSVAATTIYSNDAVTADVILRPRVDGSAIGTGAALTGDPPHRIALHRNSTISFAVTNGNTNVTWKCILIYEKP